MLLFQAQIIYPVLNGHFTKSRIFCQWTVVCDTSIQRPPLLSDLGHLRFAIRLLLTAFYLYYWSDQKIIFCRKRIGNRKTNIWISSLAEAMHITNQTWHFALLHGTLPDTLPRTLFHLSGRQMTWSSGYKSAPSTANSSEYANRGHLFGFGASLLWYLHLS